MRDSFHSLLTLGLFFCSIELGCNDNPAPSSSASKYPGNLLVNSRFQYFGQPSFHGWTIDDSDLITLSSDVPQGEFGCSIVIPSLTADSTIDLPIALSLSQTVPAPMGKHVYRLSYWAKNVSNEIDGWGGIVSIYSIEGGSSFYWMGEPFSETAGNWEFISQYSDTLDVLSANRSFHVMIFGASGGVGIKTYFHNCKLEILN